MLDVAALDRMADRLRVASACGGADALLERGRRRALGAYFTPAPVVELTVAATLAPLLARGVSWRRDGSPALTVLDPAAGDGRFLAAAGRALADRAAERGFPRARAERAIVARCLIGVERDPTFAGAARTALGRAADVRCAEALLAPPASLAGGGAVDAVIGNPPYQRSIHLERADPTLWRALRGRYQATSYGEWDLYGAFLEQSLGWLRDGGEAGLVVPSRWLTAGFARRLRGELARRAAVRAVVDFGAWQIFAGATVYAAIVLLTRAPARHVFVARWRGQAWRSGTVAAATLGAAPWRLSVGRARADLARLAAAGPALGEVARIVKGAGTNADDVFVVRVGPRRGENVVAWSRALGARVELEGGLLRACLRGRDVQADGTTMGDAACIVPYDGAELIAGDQLRRRWPRTWAYLEACRSRLDQREGGRFAGPAFFAFGRPQNLGFFFDRAAKVVVPDVTRGGRAVLDRTGAFVLDSAYALRLLPGAPAGTSLALIRAVLGSSIATFWLRETGVLLRGDYLRMKTAYLRALPLPVPSKATRAAARLAARARLDRAAVDEALRRAYGLAVI
jgi:hypothetical protein